MLKFNMKDLISRILKEEIDEYASGITFNNIEENAPNMEVIYQLAFRDRIESIFKYGFSREFKATAGGNAYCSGIYSTFDFKSTVRNSQTKSSFYGDTIIKMLIPSYDRYFICNEKIAKRVYGNKYRIKDQIEYLLKDTPDLYHKVINSYRYDEIITPQHWTSDNVRAFLIEMGGMGCRCDKNLNRADIRGLVFTGRNDGNVTVIRDYKSIIPYAYSTDHGNTWKRKYFSPKTIENSANDYDPIIFLGNDAELYINPTSYRMKNGYMLVQRKTDKKYNLMDENHHFISDIWFDSASAMDSNGKSLVNYNGMIFYIKKDGAYIKDDDNIIHISFEDLKDI